MTNQTRDFDKSEARVLAEFADLHIEDMPEGYVIVKHPIITDTEQPFQPWLLVSEQWQIQSLKDAVREKCNQFKADFRSLLADELDFPPKPDVSRGQIERELERDIEFIAAPPEAICESILELEGD